MKQCRECGEIKLLSEYYSHPQMADGHLNKCKSCVRERVATHRGNNLDRIRAYDRDRAKQPERVKRCTNYMRRYRKAFPERYKAHTLVSNAVRDGKLEKLPCAICGEPRVEAHHPDYRKPLRVIWLCSACHSAVHFEKVCLCG